MGRPKKKNDFESIVKSKLKDSNTSVLEKEESDVKVKKLKKPKTTEVEEIEEIEKQFRVIQKRYASCEIEYDVYHKIPLELVITKFTDVGSRVIVATYPAFHKIYFVKYMDIGVPHFPRGGIQVYNLTIDQTQYHSYESVALHPTKKDKYKVSILT